MNRSSLSSWLRSKVEASNLSEVQFAERIGVNSKTLNHILNHPEHTPKLEVLGQLAYGLGVPIEELLRLIGFAVGSESASVNEHVARLVEKLPRLQAIAENLAELRPDEVQAVEAYIDFVRSRRR